MIVSAIVIGLCGSKKQESVSIFYVWLLTCRYSINLCYPSNLILTFLLEKETLWCHIVLRSNPECTLS